MPTSTPLLAEEGAESLNEGTAIPLCVVESFAEGAPDEPRLSKTSAAGEELAFSQTCF